MIREVYFMIREVYFEVEETQDGECAAIHAMAKTTIGDLMIATLSIPKEKIPALIICLQELRS